MRILVRIGSVLAGIAYLALLVVAHRVGSLSDGSGGARSNPADLLLVYPLVYLGICFYTSFALQKGRNLLILGGAANALLIALAIGMCFMGSTGWVFLFPVAVSVCLWTFMYHLQNRQVSLSNPTSIAADGGKLAHYPSFRCPTYPEPQSGRQC
jgi:hypothetical protein